MLALLFLREVLKEFTGKFETSGDAALTDALLTPTGTFGGILESQLELLQIPYVSETGRVGRIPIKKLYLDNVLNELANNLHLDMKNLFDGSREFVIAANVDIDTGDECCPCYYATTKNPDDKENMEHLESTVMYALGNNLDTLPPSVANGWRKNVLLPLVAHIRSKIETDHSEGSE